MRDRMIPKLECLDTRKLLSASTVAASAADVVTPLALTGTLDVNLSEASTVQNDDGSETTTVPVEGRLGTLGKITGTWYHSLDSFGDYEGPDTLLLSANHSKGSFTISFEDNDTGMTAKPIGHGVSYFQHAQKLSGGSGSFAKVSEHGSIELMLNTNQQTYKSLVLISVPPSVPAVS